MATKSILKSVNIRNKGAALSLARAMENAHTKADEPVKISRSVSEATEEEIKKCSEQINDRVQNCICYKQHRCIRVLYGFERF